MLKKNIYCFFLCKRGCGLVSAFHDGHGPLAEVLALRVRNGIIVIVVLVEYRDRIAGGFKSSFLERWMDLLVPISGLNVIRIPGGFNLDRIKFSGTGLHEGVDPSLFQDGFRYQWHAVRALCVGLHGMKGGPFVIMDLKHTILKAVLGGNEGFTCVGAGKE